MRTRVNKLVLILFVLALAPIFQIGLSSAVMHEIDYNVSSQGEESGAKFVVQTLKYEPFPVNAGDWFDLWVEIQNVGVEDATNAQFELMPSYPFSADEPLVRNYGIVPGARTAFENKQNGETGVEANKVILKFRVKVSDNAPSGESVLKLQTGADNTKASIIESLPIEVGKESTDFLVVLENSNDYGTSFSLTNTGEGNANSVVIETDSTQWETNGARSAAVGKVYSGDTTRFSIQGVPTSDSVDLTISYTDDSGVRRVTTKSLSVSEFNVSSSMNGDPNYLKWIFGLMGIFIGALILSLARKVHKKRRR